MKKLALVLLFCLALPCLAARVTISLDGTWDIADSLSADQVPAAYTHKTPVPGLAHSSTPAFADVDLFDSRELIVNRVGRGDMPRSALVTNAGVPHQNRNYFWYRTSFTASARRAVAILTINKAQFGTAVWLNGKKIGEHFGCFTAGIFNITEAMKWDGPNELVVRVGAHPAVLPANVNGGTDFEKNRWTPGIYDSVSVALSDNPVIETIQVAPRIQTSEITVQTQIRNYGGPAAFELKHVVKPWKQARSVSEPAARRISLAAGETKTITETVKVPNAKLWTPEEPNLYVLETSTGGDSVSTRFGMREFRFDTPTKRAYLNGKPYFMRGSNITLHRFFEDPQSGTLPWNEQWVRKLLVDIPKKMSWNSFRFCIGPVPDRWLEIADEAGLLIQNEYFFWIGHTWHGNDYKPVFDSDQLIGEFKEWMRDNWNHPSVAIWDANNESWYPDFTTKIIPAVRSLDLSNRPWENSYNGPVGPDDPVEDHPYEHQAVASGGGEFKMSDLESRRASTFNAEPPTGHALILNEYGWLWLNRDGSPTELTNKLYPRLLGPDSTAEQRLALNAYLLAGLTEFWRAHREYAAVLHFVYLTMSDPKGFTCDHFRDLANLKLDPHFEDYMGEAFKPLGVYINFFRPTLEADSARTFTVMMINDDSEPVRGDLALSLENEKGEAVARQSQPFSIAALGQQTLFVDFKVPSTKGKFLLKATAQPEGARHKGPTLSRRQVEVK
jgi:hypothetical protein